MLWWLWPKLKSKNFVEWLVKIVKEIWLYCLTFVRRPEGHQKNWLRGVLLIKVFWNLNQKVSKMAVRELMFLIKLQAWRLRTPKQMFFNDFRQRFHNTMLTPVLVFQKPPCRGVLRKKCSKNMQQIYSSIPMSKCDFNKDAKQLYWNHTSAWAFSCKFAAYFQNTFS